MKRRLWIEQADEFFEDWPDPALCHAPTDEELSNAIGWVPADVVLEFIHSLTEIEVGPDDWPEYHALLLALAVAAPHTCGHADD